MTLQRKDLRASKVKTTQDPAALVLKTELDVGDAKLTLLNVYAPLNIKGDTSTWVQALNTMRKLNLAKEGTTPADYAYQVIEKAVREATEKGRHVIVGGDYNEDHNEDSKMNEVMTGLQLANLVRSDHTFTPETFKGGKRTLDHV